MKITRTDHEINLVDEEYRNIVSVLLNWEDSLSDGYGYYCSYSVGSDEAYLKYKGDHVLATLAEIAKEIKGLA